MTFATETVAMSGRQKVLKRINSLLVYCLVILSILLFIPVIMNLFSVWYSEPDYSHGFVVIPLSIYFIWMKRDELNVKDIEGSWIGLPLFCISVATYLIAWQTNFHTLTFISILSIIFNLVLFNCGWKITKKFIPAILFLIFMFPIPSAYYILMTNPLKLFVTKVSSVLISLIGIPVYKEGNILFLSSMQLEVAEACSGIRSLYSYMMLGCMFALMLKQWYCKALLLISTIFLALLVNILRVTGTGILANYLGARVAQGFFHEFSGILLFLLGFFSLAGEYALFRFKWDGLYK